MLSKTIAGSGALLLLLMVVTPTTYMGIKTTLLAVTLLLIVFKSIAAGRLPIDYRVFTISSIMVLIGLFHITHGLIAEAPGAMASLKVYVLWPMVFMLLITAISQEKDAIASARLLIYALFFVVAYSFFYALVESGLISTRWYFHIEMAQDFGINSDGFGLKVLAIQSVIFLLPFLIACFLLLSKEDCTRLGTRPITLFLGIVAASFFALLTGRRSLWVAVLLSPAVLFAIRCFTSREYRASTAEHFWRGFVVLGVFGICSFFALVSLLEIDMDLITNALKRGFDLTDLASNDSTRHRVEQISALLVGLEGNLFWGNGLGAGSYESIRSENIWEYELYYVSLLYQVGILGFMFYAAAVSWIFFVGRQVVLRNDLLGRIFCASLVGLACFLIANATNPYLAKFDGLWTLFFPVALLNVWFARNEVDEKEI